MTVTGTIQTPEDQWSLVNTGLERLLNLIVFSAICLLKQVPNILGMKKNVKGISFQESAGGDAAGDDVTCRGTPTS